MYIFKCIMRTYSFHLNNLNTICDVWLTIYKQLVKLLTSRAETQHPVWHPKWVRITRSWSDPEESKINSEQWMNWTGDQFWPFIRRHTASSVFSGLKHVRHTRDGRTEATIHSRFSSWEKHHFLLNVTNAGDQERFVRLRRSGSNRTHLLVFTGSNKRAWNRFLPDGLKTQTSICDIYTQTSSHKHKQLIFHPKIKSFFFFKDFFFFRRFCALWQIMMIIMTHFPQN